MSQIYAAIRKKKLKATPGLILIAEKDEATKKSSNLAASPSSSGKNEIRIGCPTLITIYLSGISEAGRNIAEHNAPATSSYQCLPRSI
jgi:hypothetical protein